MNHCCARTEEATIRAPLLIICAARAVAAMRLAARDVKGVAAFLASDECQNVVVLTGAGVSCAAGIPDFRSPGGMYDTLQPELITAMPEERAAMARDPTTVVLKDMFLRNQFPYHEVRRPFILGTQRQQWKATLFHRFLEVLDAKGKLLKLVTQNIDGLDFQTCIPPEKICACHGSVGRAACEGCGAPVAFDDFCERVRANIKDINGVDANAPSESSEMLCDACRRPLLKPTTVLFGASLPQSFFEVLEEELPQAELVIVAGTSLVVSPANLIALGAPGSTPRIICDWNDVGRGVGIDCASTAREDVWLEGDADDCAVDLAACGWLEELSDLRANYPKRVV